VIPLVQKICHDLGEAGCYEFSIMIAGEQETGIDLEDPLAFHVSNLFANRVAPDCMVLDAGAVMAAICGGKWQCLKAGIGRDSSGRQYDLALDYVLRPGEHDIHRYERTVSEGPGIQKVLAHFFYAGPGKMIDPYGESLTRLQGKLISRRVLRKIA
jgi:hypothetical protein